MKKLFLLTALFVAAAFPSCSKHDGVETPDWPEPQPLAIAFAEGNELFFGVDETKTVHYTITGGSANNVVKVEMQNPDDAYTVETTPISATEGTITITAKMPSTDNCVIVTVSDGSQTLTAEIAVSTKPNPEELAITFAEGNLLLLNINEPRTIHYTITGGSAKTVVTAEMQKPNGAYIVETTSTSAKEGTITITAKQPIDSYIIVTVSDGLQTITTVIVVSTKSGSQGIVITVETPGTLSQLLADYDKSSIAELTVIGNLNSSDISTLNRFENLAILDMENVNLEKLPERAFYFYNTSLTSVKLPLTLKTIGRSAFEGCRNLTSITIPDSVTLIEVDAFKDCTGLTGVYITNVAKWCEIEFHIHSPLEYAHNLYLNGKLVTDLVIPDSVTAIGDYAFSGCTSLTSVTIPDSVTEIGSGAFYNCSGLTSVTIPDGVTTIESYAFYNCTSLTSVTIPDSVTEIGSFAFSGCSSLTSITIGNNVTEIGQNTFTSCSNLTSVTIGNSVKSIGSQAFMSCRNLISITIPDNVTTIEDYAFNYCSSLTSVTIGSSVTFIGDRAFYKCSSLANIYCKAIVPPSIKNNTFNGVSATATLYVPKGSKTAYAMADTWKNFTQIEETQF